MKTRFIEHTKRGNDAAAAVVLLLLAELLPADLLLQVMVLIGMAPTITLL